MKNIIFSISFLLFTCLFLSCSGVGYVRNEPTYEAIERPRQPGSAYIWIEGDWIWQRDTRTYKNSQGRWEMPIRGKNYRQGFWETKRKGKRWVPGKWNR